MPESSLLPVGSSGALMKAAELELTKTVFRLSPRRDDRAAMRQDIDLV